MLSSSTTPTGQRRQSRALSGRPGNTAGSKSTPQVTGLDIDLLSSQRSSDSTRNTRRTASLSDSRRARVVDEDDDEEEDDEMDLGATISPRDFKAQAFKQDQKQKHQQQQDRHRTHRGAIGPTASSAPFTTVVANASGFVSEEEKQLQAQHAKYALHISRGGDMHKRRRWRDAAQEYTLAVEVLPKDIYAHRMRATCSIAAGDLTQAFVDAKKVMELEEVQYVAMQQKRQREVAAQEEAAARQRSAALGAAGALAASTVSKGKSQSGARRQGDTPTEVQKASAARGARRSQQQGSAGFAAQTSSAYARCHNARRVNATGTSSPAPTSTSPTPAAGTTSAARGRAEESGGPTPGAIAGTVLEDKKPYYGLLLLARVLYAQGDFEEAARHFAQGRRLRPDVDEFVQGANRCEETLRITVSRRPPPPSPSFLPSRAQRASMMRASATDPRVSYVAHRPKTKYSNCMPEFEVDVLFLEELTKSNIFSNAAPNLNNVYNRAGCMNRSNHPANANIRPKHKKKPPPPKPGRPGSPSATGRGGKGARGPHKRGAHRAMTATSAWTDEELQKLMQQPSSPQSPGSKGAGYSSSTPTAAQTVRPSSPTGPGGASPPPIKKNLELADSPLFRTAAGGIDNRRAAATAAETPQRASEGKGIKKGAADAKDAGVTENNSGAEATDSKKKRTKPRTAEELRRQCNEEDEEKRGKVLVSAEKNVQMQGLLDTTLTFLEGRRQFWVHNDPTIKFPVEDASVAAGAFHPSMASKPGAPAGATAAYPLGGGGGSLHSRHRPTSASVTGRSSSVSSSVGAPHYMSSTNATKQRENVNAEVIHLVREQQAYEVAKRPQSARTRPGTSTALERQERRPLSRASSRGDASSAMGDIGATEAAGGSSSSGRRMIPMRPVSEISDAAKKELDRIVGNALQAGGGGGGAGSAATSALSGAVPLSNEQQAVDAYLATGSEDDDDGDVIGDGIRFSRTASGTILLAPDRHRFKGMRKKKGKSQRTRLQRGGATISSGSSGDDEEDDEMTAALLSATDAKDITMDWHQHRSQLASILEQEQRRQNKEREKQRWIRRRLSGQYDVSEVQEHETEEGEEDEDEEPLTTTTRSKERLLANLKEHITSMLPYEEEMKGSSAFLGCESKDNQKKKKRKGAWSESGKGGAPVNGAAFASQGMATPFGLGRAGTSIGLSNRMGLGPQPQPPTTGRPQSARVRSSATTALITPTPADKEEKKTSPTGQPIASTTAAEDAQQQEQQQQQAVGGGGVGGFSQGGMLQIDRDDDEDAETASLASTGTTQSVGGGAHMLSTAGPVRPSRRLASRRRVAELQSQLHRKLFVIRQAAEQGNAPTAIESIQHLLTDLEFVGSAATTEDTLTLAGMEVNVRLMLASIYSTLTEWQCAAAEASRAVLLAKKHGSKLEKAYKRGLSHLARIYRDGDVEVLVPIQHELPDERTAEATGKVSGGPAGSSPGVGSPGASYSSPQYDEIQSMLSSLSDDIVSSDEDENERRIAALEDSDGEGYPEEENDGAEDNQQ